MGIFSKSNNLFTQKEFSHHISPAILKEMGFEETWWGSPRYKNDPNHKCWERTVFLKDNSLIINSISIYFFPENFDGYVMEFTNKRISARNAILMWLNVGDYQWSCVVENEADFIEKIEYKIRQIKKENGYE